MAREELSRECDYELEAANQKRFRDVLSNAKGFYVPYVVDDTSSKRVLTTELVSGNLSISFVLLLCLNYKIILSDNVNNIFVDLWSLKKYGLHENNCCGDYCLIG